MINNSGPNNLAFINFVKYPTNSGRVTHSSVKVHNLQSPVNTMQDSKGIKPLLAGERKDSHPAQPF